VDYATDSKEMKIFDEISNNAIRPISTILGKIVDCCKDPYYLLLNDKPTRLGNNEYRYVHDPDGENSLILKYDYKYYYKRARNYLDVIDKAKLVAYIL